jgi:tRNA (guanine37-N1)-methyltransferase
MRLDVVTIFPDYFSPLGLSLIGKAREQGLLDVRVHDLRRWASDRHRTVDDTPYGGGAGMVMRPDVWGVALEDLAPPGATPPRLVLPTPSGVPFTQRLAGELASEPWLLFACGRYEGIDARVAQAEADRMPVTEISLGDYVVNGGEVAALSIIEAVARLLPGVLGNAESLTEESMPRGLLGGAVYTKPPSWRGRDVPAVLLSRRPRRDRPLAARAGAAPDRRAAPGPHRRLDPARCDARDLAVLTTPAGPYATVGFSPGRRRCGRLGRCAIRPAPCHRGCASAADARHHRLPTARG